MILNVSWFVAYGNPESVSFTLKLRVPDVVGYQTGDDKG